MPYASLNRVTIVGNLTHDPELRDLPSGGCVCRLRIACNGRRRGPDGSFEHKPNYFDVAVFGARGEIAHRYLEKGRPVAVDGRLDWRTWETADGERRQAVEIVASDVQFLRGAGRGEAGADEGEGIDASLEDAEGARAATEAELAA